MSAAWANEYGQEADPNFHQYPRSQPRRCENPHCHFFPLFNLYIVRNPISGDVKEIGRICKQRWNRLRGIATEAWFEEYDKALKMQAALRPGGILSWAETKEIQREVQKTWQKKQAEKGQVFLRRIDMPMENFPTVEEAEKYALERGGYCEGLDPSRKFYIIHVRREPTQREKVLALMKAKQIDLVRVDLTPHQYPTQEDAERFAKEHGGYFSQSDRGRWIIYVNPRYAGEY